jgi:hypothetical protein
VATVNSGDGIGAGPVSVPGLAPLTELFCSLIPNEPAAIFTANCLRHGKTLGSTLCGHISRANAMDAHSF